MGKEVATDVKDHPLCSLHHRLRIPRARDDANGVDDGRELDATHEGSDVSHRKRVHDWLDHIGPHQVGRTARRDEHGDHEQREPGMTQIRKERPERAAQVLRTLGSPSPRHCDHLPRRRQRDLARPRPRQRSWPVQLGTRRALGRWGHAQAARHGSPWHARVRRRESRSGRRP